VRRADIESCEMDDRELKRLRAIFARAEERPLSGIRKVMRNLTLRFGDYVRKKAIADRIKSTPPKQDT
jgi:hypothetical protein